MKKENSIYHVNSTVSNLNHVPGFDPMHYVRATENGMILDTPYQKLWFRLKFPNGKVKSMLVKLTDQLSILTGAIRNRLPAILPSARKEKLPTI